MANQGHFDPNYLMKYTNTYADQAKKDLFPKPEGYDYNILKPYLCSKYSNAAGFITPKRFCDKINTDTLSFNDNSIYGPKIKTTKIDFDFNPNKKNPYNLVNKMRKDIPEYMWLHDPGTQVKPQDNSFVFDEQINIIKKMFGK